MTGLPSRRPGEHVGPGRHLTKSQLRTCAGFFDAGRLLEEALARHLKKFHGMTSSDYDVLVRLDEAGGEMRMVTLAAQVVSSAQKLTHTANRLEQRGWITRRPAEGDGRGLMAVVTPKGSDALSVAAEEHSKLVKRFLLDVLTPDERKTIATFMERVSTHVRAHRGKHDCDQCKHGSGTTS